MSSSHVEKYVKLHLKSDDGSIRFMPSYAPDLELLHATREYVSEAHDGIVKRAAIALDVEYAMLRRFLAGGRAKPENRQKLRNALEAGGRRVAKQRKITHEVPIEVTRSVLTQLLRALDAFQSPTANEALEA